MKRTQLLLFLVLLSCQNARAQADTDTLINNLVHAPDYKTTEWGQLPYAVHGHGKQPMIILPGAGFDGSIFKEFIASNIARYTMYVVTLPGYGDTKAYPMPQIAESYSQQNWISGVIAGIRNLIETQKLEQPVLAAHFLISTHIALRMAAEHADLLGKVIIIGGPVELKLPPPYDTLGYTNRIMFTDKYLAPYWFKTLNRETWLNGNFMPETYSLDTVQAKRFWETANQAPLPVHIRYLCENWGADFSKYEQVQVPVLVLAPSFQSGLLEKACNRYLEPWSYENWQVVADKNKKFQLVQVANSACNIMYDQLETLNRLVADFLEK